MYVKLLLSAFFYDITWCIRNSDSESVSEYDPVLSSKGKNGCCKVSFPLPNNVRLVLPRCSEAIVFLKINFRFYGQRASRFVLSNVFKAHSTLLLQDAKAN